MADTTSLIDALATNLGESLGAMTGTAVRTRPTVGEADVAWQVGVQVSGSGAGTVWLGLTRDGATQLVASILGDPSLVTDADVVDTLKELVGQAASAHAHGAGKGLTLTVDAPAEATAPAAVDAQQYDLLIGTGDPIRIVGWGRTISAGVQPARAAAAPAAAATPVVASPAGPAPRNLDVVLDIELPITVRFGETQMTLESLARLGPGSMIDLDRAPDDPVDLLVNGRLVARGQVVVVSGCYGIRVNEVVSPADRLRSLEL
ncbi:MAG TPA: flagellar motor switch protein FliN [Luteitalea sp.]|nr:flagellar motor switch protein FliN [Luteitalea sp.]